MVKERIGVFGGAFNPLTMAHLFIAEHLAEDYVDRVLFLPVADDYPKPDLAPAQHRLAMLQQVLGANELFLISTLEIERQAATFTYDSLKELKAQFPQAELYFIVGSDHLKTIHTWGRSQELLAENRFILMVRGAEASATAECRELLANSPHLQEYASHFRLCDDHPRSNLNSSLIRQRLAAGKSVRYLTDPQVIGYIDAWGLYKQE